MAIVALMAVVIGCSKKSNPTRTELLTGKTWVYDEYFRNYNQGSSGLLYKIGKPNNVLDLSKIQVIYSKDGTYTEITETGTTLVGTWRFINNEAGLEVKNLVGTYTSNIVVLTSSKFEWLDPVTSNGTLGRMIPR